MANLLAIDDEKDMLALIKTALEKDGHRVTTMTSSIEVSAEKAGCYDLILLDVMMPGEDGFAFCQRVRGLIDVPMLFLTAKTEEAALVRGLSLGADDYILKPFGVAELRARVAAHLRRESRPHHHSFYRGGVRFDLAGRQAFAGEQKLPLTPGEYAICEYLAEYQQQVFTKEQIYEAVFGFEGEGDKSAITEHVKNIRAKLRAYGLHPIETVWGVGYKWIKTEKM